MADISHLDFPDFLRRRQDAAFRELAEKLKAEGRVAIGEARWVTDETGNYHIAVDTVPVSTIKLLGEAEVIRRYRQAKGLDAGGGVEWK